MKRFYHRLFHFFLALTPFVLLVLLGLALVALPAVAQAERRPQGAGERPLQIPPEEKKRLHQDMRRAWEYHSEERRTHQYERENGVERESSSYTRRDCVQTDGKTTCFRTREHSRKMSPEEREHLRKLLRQRPRERR
jgi:uncharacterized membrane protein